MEPSELRRGVAAAISTACELGLTADDALVLHDSNRVALRLMPCDILARVAGPEHAEVASLEVEIARRLAEVEAPVAAVAPRVGHRVYESAGFWITLWTYYDSVASPGMQQPAAYAGALKRLHAGLRNLDLITPHFTDRVEEARQLVARPEKTPALADADRELLGNTLRSVTQAVARRSPAEQVLHGEPHPGNVLNTTSGPLFVDFETVCRGPVEFDLAHVPDAVSDRYPGVDQELLGECRGLVLAMVAAWRFDQSDRLPNRRRAGSQLIDALRQGPPYPSLDSMMGDSRGATMRSVSR
jgi:aminoglycoside phosphotransferase (APT) family kinase protein